MKSLSFCFCSFCKRLDLHSNDSTRTWMMQLKVVQTFFASRIEGSPLPPAASSTRRDGSTQALATASRSTSQQDQLAQLAQLDTSIQIMLAREKDLILHGCLASAWPLGLASSPGRPCRIGRPTQRLWRRWSSQPEIQNELAKLQIASGRSGK